MQPGNSLSRCGGTEWNGRDLLILAFLVLAAIHCVRSDFFVNESGGIDWRGYASGEIQMPFQGRVGMIPVLRWAEHSGVMVQGAAKYESMMSVASKYSEPVSVEKFASLVVGLIAVLAMLGYCVAYSRRRGFEAWWLPSVLMLLILMVTLAVRSEHDVWTPYDLPHAALFGIAVMCAFESEWWLMLALFSVDVVLRETSVYLLAVSIPMSWMAWRGVEPRRLRVGVMAGVIGAFEGEWWPVLAPLALDLHMRKTSIYLLAASIPMSGVAWRGVGSRNLRVGVMAGVMGGYWLAWRMAIQRRFAGNPNDTGLHWGANFHELVFPHHWPQMFSAGGYLIVFVWLARGRLCVEERLLLWCTLVTAPVTLYFGRWGETRIWLEWTLPWAVLAARELEQYFREYALGPGENRRMVLG
jgi:hypothetical protein